MTRRESAAPLETLSAEQKDWLLEFLRHFEPGENMGRLRQFIVEYVGNLHPSHRTDPADPSASEDRRKNRYARELIDWIERQMEARGFPTAKKRELVTHLRLALRQGAPMEDGEGVSRDAPS